SIAPEWPVDQIAPIDRNILRIAAFEILVDHETPPKVAINEAVELAKMFGSDSSSRFVNGVLGTLLADRAKYASQLKGAAGQAEPPGLQKSPAP
ncbi:MAG: transcription antitermination protein NusB, partial [Chloroflexi bacterium]|nr:transcription antitermination protein NusB [Chloroflexota bacterium]